MINNKEYLEFPFSQIFTYKRGDRLTEAEQVPGDIAYISSTKNNNGIGSFVNPPKDMIIYKDKMTLTNSGSVGYVFFHDYEFVASDHVTVIGIKNFELTKNIALFLKPIFESIKYKYNFGREISDKRLIKEYIKLPVDKDGNPDWQFMEDYIKSLTAKIEFKKIYVSQNSNMVLNMNKWKEFKLTDIFPDIESCKCSKAGDLPDGYDIYYLGAKKKDCCVIKKVTTAPELVTKGKCIAFICDGDGSVGYSNYIDFDTFIGTTNLAVGYNENLNQYTGLFLVTILDLERSKYSFGRKYKKRLSNTTIKLPSDKNNNPDWQFMEDYIKSLPYSDNI